MLLQFLQFLFIPVFVLLYWLFRFFSCFLIFLFVFLLLLLKSFLRLLIILFAIVLSLRILLLLNFLFFLLLDDLGVWLLPRGFLISLFFLNISINTSYLAFLASA